MIKLHQFSGEDKPSMVNDVLAMALSTQRVTPLLPGLHDRKLFFSFGNQIPELDKANLSYWMGGAFAVKLQTVGMALNLCSPGADWLPQLDVSLTGRVVHEGTLSDLAEFKGNLWVKPSEAKIGTLPAGLYDYKTVEKIFAESGFSDDISLQWTDSIMRINFEHRFFIVEGEVITGSPYLVDGVGYHKGINDTRMGDAQNFLEYALASMDEQPPAFVVDVGFNELTQSWFIIEANRAWSSGFYGCDPTAALEVVDAASCITEDKWLWKPDAHLLELVKEWNPLRVVTGNPDSSEFFEYMKEGY